MAVDPVAGPVFASVAAQSAIQTSRKAGEAMGILQVEDEPLKEILAQIERCVRKIADFLEPDGAEQAWLEVLKDGNAPIYLDKKGHKYQAIFVTVATSVVFNVFGLGTYTAALPAGWSFTPFPDKTEVWLSTAGTQANVLFLATDNTIGTAI